MNTPTRLTERKREGIVNAAVALFNEQGFDNTSMDGIAERAQVSKRTVYNHFASKEQLFVEIVNRLKERATAAVSLEYDSRQPLQTQLEAFCRSVIDFHCSPESRKCARVLVSKFIKTPQLAKDILGNAKVFEVQLYDWLRRAQQEGRLQECDIPFATKQLLGLIETFVIWPQLIKNAPVPSKATRANIAQSASEMFLGFYGRK